MRMLELMAEYDHEQVDFCHDKASSLRAIIGIHDTTLGPALGGTRMWPYKTEEEALTDVLRLSRGMTYKNSSMGLALGGGKAVIIGDPRKDKSEELFRAFGKFVESLGGRYITAEDVGTTTEDMSIIRGETTHVVGLEGQGRSGDPSPVTAYGVFRAMAASLREAFGSDEFLGMKVAVQGVGAVGYHLVKYLLDAGAKVTVTDIFPEKAQRAVELGAEAVPPDGVYDVECDIFAPCALGAIINDSTIPRLNAKVVCGSANNQLLENRHGEILAQRGILYAPDFIANGGGVINVALDMSPQGYSLDGAMARVSGIYDILLKIFDIAKEMGLGTNRAAEVYAETRIKKALSQKRMFLPR